MITFAEIPPFMQGLVGLIVVLLFFATVVNAVLEVSHRHYTYVCSLAVIALVLYCLFQCICDICSHMNTLYEFLNRMEDSLGKTPVWVPAVMLLGVAAAEVYIFRRNVSWRKDNITPSSIREAIDNLPAGICCYEPTGQVMMKNNTMEYISRSCTGESLLNALAFRNAIASEPERTEGEAIRVLVDKRVFSVSDKPFSGNGSELRIMTATDITAQYEHTERLRAKQELVVRLNRELSEYGKQIVSSITAREVLNAKVKLHDELGANLLAVKRYILQGGTDEERTAIENILRKNLRYLKNETVVKEKDEYAVILDTAAKLDMKIRVIGSLTETEPFRHVIVTGIHECLTNTIRHAGGDELTVVLTTDADKVTATFTNNGRAPEQKITERGGLALLRALAGECGGTIRIQSEPRFELTIVLPKEDDSHGI